MGRRWRHSHLWNFPQIVNRMARIVGIMARVQASPAMQWPPTTQQCPTMRGKRAACAHHELMMREQGSGTVGYALMVRGHEPLAALHEAMFAGQEPLTAQHQSLLAQHGPPTARHEATLATPEFSTAQRERLHSMQAPVNSMHTANPDEIQQWLSLREKLSREASGGGEVG